MFENFVICSLIPVSVYIVEERALFNYFTDQIYIYKMTWSLSEDHSFLSFHPFFIVLPSSSTHLQSPPQRKNDTSRKQQGNSK